MHSHHLPRFLADSREIPVRISLPDFLAHHLIQGRSGSGKSRSAESILIQLLQSFPHVSIVGIDGKGELFERMRLWIAAMLFKMNEKARLRFLDRVVIVDPFHPSLIPPLNFCTSLPTYPAELLAEEILGGLRRLFSEDKLTTRMEVLLRNTLIALIEAGRETQSLSLLEARDLLNDGVFREQVLLRVRNEEARSYFSRDFPHESHGTIDAVKSRLSYLLLSEQIRVSFGAEECLQFRAAIEQGKVVLINLGKTLLATDTAREVVGTLLLSSFLRAVFSRPMNHGPHILAFMDEFQNLVVSL